MKIRKIASIVHSIQYKQIKNSFFNNSNIHGAQFHKDP
ncbi:hypothetical protein LEP1GSC132_0695 [Leptospira kirschneri str. 200803703]|uniref:Uncharacterized protein n=2 Tax=Leptospira kirschneri TaxID=29507 RepID=A0A0E2BHU0_9LEPT|nr:hypothetical protein LEP1GSC081_2741 [Leptospira kirschneri str. H1]EKO62910.1 hypothetical protein LEP1GSC082_1089 [Leptospira kirschneri str. H2]EMK26047.1 hypothetical protein LEP1GSC008_3626 [Leptospira kirschneri serovar Bulgarica str. Nikolaevo]EMO65976.1 hypothetical protein LEP1GSC132_0695 [Leptospira kirschneri str. 200803703]